MSSRRVLKKKKIDDTIDGDKINKQNVMDSNDGENDEDLSDLNESGDSEDNEMINKEISIEFGAYPPIDDDFNGIKQLLVQLWLKENINLTELSKTIIKNDNISTIIRQETDDYESDDDDDDGEDDVYGVTSVIGLNSTDECIKQIKSVIEKHLINCNDKLMCELINSDSNIGLIINERFANIPPKISLPSYESLICDMKKLGKNYNWFLYICKILKPKASSVKCDDVIYVNAEDEIFDELSEHKCEYSISDQCDDSAFGINWKDDENLYEPFRKVLLISDKNWLIAVQKLKTEFK